MGLLYVSYYHCLQVAGRTNDAAGDGTTTASVLARDLIHYGLQVSCSLYLPCDLVGTSDVIPPFLYPVAFLHLQGAPGHNISSSLLVLLRHSGVKNMLQLVIVSHLTGGVQG